MAEADKGLTEKLAVIESERDELIKKLAASEAETAKLKEDAPNATELQKSLDEAQAEITKLKEQVTKSTEPEGEAAKLQKSLDESTVKIAKLQAQADEAVELAKRVQLLEADKSTAAHAAVFKALKDDGKLPPSLEEWASKRTAEELTDWGKGAPPVLKAGRTHVAANPDGTLVLTTTEKQACKALNVSEEKFIETRKAEIKKQADRQELLSQ